MLMAIRRPASRVSSSRSRSRARRDRAMASASAKGHAEGDRPGRRPLISRVHQDPDASALLVTNMWPGDPDLPVYGIFVRRQVDSLIRGGLRCDVLYVRGHRSPLAYALAALLMMAWNLRRRRYRLVHALAGEALLPARAYLRAPVVVTFRGSDLLGKPGADGRMPWSWRFRRR